MNGFSMPYFTSTILNGTLVYGVLLLFFLFKSKNQASKLLGWYLTINLCYVALCIFSTNGIETLFFIIGPVLYLYVQSFFEIKNKVAWMHFLPFVAVTSYRVYSTGFIGLEQSHLFLKASGVHLLIYLFFSIWLILEKTHQRGISMFNNPGSRLVWFRNFVLYQALILLYLCFNFFFKADYNPTLIAILMSINVVFVFFQIIRESSFFGSLPLGNKYAKSSLTADQKSAIVKKLEVIMREEKYYTQKNASLSNLAEKLNTSSHNLSQVLNENQKSSFFDMISRHRIRAAKKLLKDARHAHEKVEEVADRVGYNSKSAFNTAFKKLTGITPSEYREGKDVLTYGDEHLPNRKIPIFKKYTRTFDQAKIKTDMLHNFLKIFFRNSKRNKIFSLLNLFGLTIGFACSMLIYLFINDELSYDEHLPDNERIYRVYWFGEEPQTRTPHPMAQAFKKDFPEVESAVSISPWYGAGMSRQTVTVLNKQNNVRFEEPDFYFVDSTFFDVFDYRILSGNSVDPLIQPNGVIITQAIADKYFTDQNPIGKELTIGEDKNTLSVVAVVETPPDNAHFNFNFLYSYVNIKNNVPDDQWMLWADMGHFNYVKLRTGTNYKSLEDKVAPWVITYLNWSSEAEDRLLSGENAFKLQPIKDIHLKSHLRWELEANGNMLYIYILTGTLMFILLIAAINYINLTTAKSVERAKEIGVKKTLGARKNLLSFQFFVESIFFCLIAFSISLILVVLLIPDFNNLSGKHFSMFDILNISFLLKSFSISVFIGLVSGIYPALMMSSIIPTEILKGKFSKSSKGNRLRNILVVLQFSVSAILICGSLIVLKQIDFLKSKDLGFEKEHVISLPIKTSNIRNKLSSLKNELNKIPAVLNATAVSNVPGGQFNQNSVSAESTPDLSVGASELQVDFDALKVLSIDLAIGRTFNKTHTADSAGLSFIINESAAKALNLDNPIGQRLIWNDDEMVRIGSVVGVVKDFHYKSLHTSIQPLIVQINPNDFNHILIKIDADGIPKTLKNIEETFSRFDQEYVFEYSFLDHQIDNLYQSEVRTLEIFSLFSMVALFLASLGLLGIAIATLNQKIKEVGIRKILGASSAQITRMILVNFSKLVLIALCLGLPIAWLLMSEWMNEFPYQTAIGFVPFVISSMLLIVVAIGSVSVVVLRIAYSNPVNALRYE